MSQKRWAISGQTAAEAFVSVLIYLKLLSFSHFQKVAEEEI